MADTACCIEDGCTNPATASRTTGVQPNTTGRVLDPGDDDWIEDTELVCYDHAQETADG